MCKVFFRHKTNRNYPDMRATVVVFVFFIIFSSRAYGLSEDENQPTYMEADQVTIDDKAGTSIYSGNVSLKQGSLKINAETLTIITDDDGGVRRYVAVGQPAVFRQRPDDQDMDTIAKASRINFRVSDNVVELNGDARIEQGGDTFTASEIIYDTDNGIFKATRSDDQQSEQVLIVIQPRGKAPSTP